MVNQAIEAVRPRAARLIRPHAGLPARKRAIAGRDARHPVHVHAQAAAAGPQPQRHPGVGRVAADVQQLYRPVALFKRVFHTSTASVN